MVRPWPIVVRRKVSLLSSIASFIIMLVVCQSAVPTLSYHPITMMMMIPRSTAGRSRLLTTATKRSLGASLARTPNTCLSTRLRQGSSDTERMYRMMNGNVYTNRIQPWRRTRPHSITSHPTYISSFYMSTLQASKTHSDVNVTTTTTTTHQAKGNNKRKKKKSKNGGGGGSSSSKKSNKLFRADRVLSNRSPDMSRSECFDLLRKKRVYMEQLPSSSTSSPIISSNNESVDADNADADNANDNETVIPERKRIQGPSVKIPMDAILYIDNKVPVGKPPPLLMVFHKPKWMLSVMNDNHGRNHLGQYIETQSHKESSTSSSLSSSSSWSVLANNNMHPVGRLDYDTSGLLLFSSNGKLTQALLHPNSHIEKEYVAIVEGKVLSDDDDDENENHEEEVHNTNNGSTTKTYLTESSLRTKLSSGVETSMGSFPAELVSTRSIPDEKVSSIIDEIISNLPPEYDVAKLTEKGYLDFRTSKHLTEIRLIVQEGKHRMVRRILANCGYPVIGLRRERLGIITLTNNHNHNHNHNDNDDYNDDELPVGTIRELSPNEQEWAEQILQRRTSSSSSAGSSS